MITNILKDGTIKDLTGHVVKQSEVPEAYELINRIKGGIDEKVRSDRVWSVDDGRNTGLHKRSGCE